MTLDEYCNITEVEPMRRKKNQGKKRLTRNNIVETLDSLFEWFDAK